MTPDEQRIAIAEMCGWHDIVRTVDSRKELVGVNRHLMKLVHRGEYVDGYAPIPNYLDDLNAIHDAELIVRISGPGSLPYRQELEIICHRTNDQPVFATAAQRAEAFLRALNLWTD